MKKELGNKGFVRNIFLLFLLVAVVFVGFSFAKPYHRWYALGSHTRDFLKTDVGNVEVIKKNVMKDAAELNVPLSAKDLDVFMVNKVIKVKAIWSETVDFWGYYQKELNFSMEEEY